MGPVIELWGPDFQLLAPFPRSHIDAVIDFCGGCEPAPGAFGDLEDRHLCQDRLYGRYYLSVSRHWWASIFGARRGSWQLPTRFPYIDVTRARDTGDIGNPCRRLSVLPFAPVCSRGGGRRPLATGGLCQSLVRAPG